MQLVTFCSNYSNLDTQKISTRYNISNFDLHLTSKKKICTFALFVKIWKIENIHKTFFRKNILCFLWGIPSPSVVNNNLKNRQNSKLMTVSIKVISRRGFVICWKLEFKDNQIYLFSFLFPFISAISTKSFVKIVAALPTAINNMTMAEMTLS